MHSRERHQVEETKQYNWQDDKVELGIQLTGVQKGVSWHCAQCNLLLTWQQCKRIRSYIIIWYDMSRIFAFLWQASVWRLLSEGFICLLSRPSRKQRSRGKHRQRQWWQHLWQRLRLLQAEWRWEMRWWAGASVFVAVQMGNFRHNYNVHYLFHSAVVVFAALIFFFTICPFFRFLKRSSFYIYCSLIVALTNRDHSVKCMCVGGEGWGVATQHWCDSPLLIIKRHTH